jgi:hypothetical protein
MSDFKKDKSINEQVKKIMHRVNYAINETPKFRQITEDDFVNDDTMPVIFQKKAEILNDNIKEDDNDVTGNTGTNVMPVDVNNVNIPQEQSVDQIQNDIIKHNLAAMHGIHDKLAELENYVKSLNQNVIELSKDVEEVKEPTTSEKLMSKKDVSYPFYYNLNDYWKGSSFEEERNKLNEKGIKQLPDGTYIADFDDLPKFSDNDLNNAFYDRNTYVY